MIENNDSPLSEAEQHIDQVLVLLGKRGLLDDFLNEMGLEQILMKLPNVPVSATFTTQAVDALEQAQQERIRQDPAVELGVTIARARQHLGLGLDEVTTRLGVSSALLDELELARLTLSQILHLFPPKTIAQLLAVVHVPVREFTRIILEFASAGGKIWNPSLKVAHRYHREPTTLVSDVAEYITLVERYTTSE